MLCAVDDRSCVALLLLDLSATFDTVDHDLLLHSMFIRFRICGRALDWFRSYLRDRSQFVGIDGFKSDTHALKYSVPQGSVLGPIIYLMYMCPLGDKLRRHNIFHLYADDTQLYATFSHKDTSELHNTVQQLETYLMDIYQ